MAIPYYTYIIESLKTKRWYYGHSQDIAYTLQEHNSGQNKSTRSKGPWRVIFKREFATKLEANRFELKLKKIKNKRFIEETYRDFFL